MLLPTEPPHFAMEWLFLRFVFSRSRVHVSARRPAALIDVSRDFLQFLQANGGTSSQIRTQLFPSKAFSIHDSLIIQPFDDI
jgi:hypothetical protein